MANLPNRKVVTVKQTIIKCDKSNIKYHYKVRKEYLNIQLNKFENFQEWETEEKLKPETRNSIRRDFLAMIRKEKELRSRQKTSNSRTAALTTLDQPAGGKIRNKNTLSPKTLQTMAVEQLETANIQDLAKEIQTNFHGEKCKTCRRMMSLMGTVLPHPVNG